MEKIGIGLVGYGTIGKIHTMNYRQIAHLYPGKLPEVRLEAVCTRREETAREAARQGGYGSWFTDIPSLVRAEGVDVVDCSLPNHLHRQALLEAFAGGKHVYCEKPLARNAEEAREIVGEARKAGVQVGMTFNFRFVPALMRARELIEEGALGEVYSFHAEYYHTGYQDPERPLSWRLRKDLAGGGALFDLGSHAIDLIRYLLGEYESVWATMHTYIKERPVSRGASEKEPVTVDDAAWLQVRLENGAIGTLEVSRFATGTLDDLNLEIYGRQGALMFRLMDANWLYWFDAGRAKGPLGGDRGWTRLETVQHYPGAALPPPRSILGWTRSHAENQSRFLSALASGKEPRPNLIDGLRTQLIMEAAYRSAESGRWEPVPKE